MNIKKKTFFLFLMFVLIASLTFIVGSQSSGKVIEIFLASPTEGEPVTNPVTFSASVRIGESHGENYTTEITQHGITWTFSEPVRYGQFVNGDYWVLGPVNVINVDPMPDGGRNGFEVNPMPGDSQPYDSRIGGYDLSLQPHLPSTIHPSSSVVSTISLNPNDGSCNVCLRTAAVLTVLDEIPANNGATVFRPPYTGTDKPLYSADDLRTELLLNLDPPQVTIPTMQSRYERIRRVQLDHKLNWMGRLMHPAENMNDYGAGITRDNGEAILRISLDDDLEEKMPLLIAFVQAGIDYHGMLNNGMIWIANGGHSSGRKFPILFSGLMLNDSEMLSIGELPENTFAEDCQTFYTTENPPFVNSTNIGCYSDLPGSYGPNFARYGVGHCLVTPSSQTFESSHGEDLICSGPWSTYWSLNSPSWVGQALAAHLYNLTDEWNHPAFFDHLDRRIEMHGFSGVWGSSFSNEMWDAYR
jgi:hypothetical protein